MDIGQWIAIGLSIVLGVWYVIGAVINRRRGLETYNWLREGLERLGKITEARWIGSAGSGARLVVGQGEPPFRRVEVVFLLESREILPLWLFNRLRHKKDEMILKAALRRAPGVELEAVRAGTRGFEKFLATAGGNRPFERIDAPTGFVMLARGRADSAWVESSRRLLQRFPEGVRQISMRKSVPHLLLRVDIPEVRSAGDDFWEALQSLAQSGAAQ